jgi:hypothetical protein
MSIEHMLCSIDAARPVELDHLLSNLYRAHGNGELTEDEYQRLHEAIDERRGQGRGSTAVRLVSSTPASPAPSPTPRAMARPRRAIYSPDRAASRQRRRDVGQERWLPPNMAAKLTQGELAVASVMVREIAKHGVCSLTNDAIAGMAGVCPTLVKNTRRFVTSLGWFRVIHRPRAGRKSLTNLVTALSPELRAWIATRRKAIGGKRVPPAQTDLRKKESSGTGLHHESRQHRACGP